MRLNTDGLIIREYHTGEADRLVTVLTRDMGIIKAFVRGARGVKSKSLSSTQLLAYSKLSFFMGRDTYTIDEAEPIEVFFGLRKDIVRLSLAQYFCELDNELAPQEENAEEYLRLTLNALYLLSKGKIPAEQLRATFQLRLVCLAGYTPDLLACGGCGEFASDEMFFDLNSASIFCPHCERPPHCERLSLGVLTAMRHICYAEQEKLFSFSLSEESVRTLAAVTEKYLLLQTQRRYKTLEFYKTLFN